MGCSSPIFGLANGGLVVNSAQGPQFGSLHDPVVLLVTAGALITPVLLAARIPAALLLSIAATAAAGLFIHHAGGKPMTALPAQYFDLPRIPHELFFDLDFGDYFRNIGKLLPITFYFLISGFFYTGSTLITVLRRASMVGGNGRIIYERRAYSTDALASVIGAMSGSCQVGAYVEIGGGRGGGGAYRVDRHGRRRPVRRVAGRVAL